jgi:glycosyltransferase involved in cell wall biosynthesis
MIFRDAEIFFEEAIRSVLEQTHPHLELLLCDDGSSDASTAIALRFSGEYPERVRYLEHPGHAWRGMSATRNLGIRAARGEFVAFLDADDTWEPTHLEEQLELLLAHPHVGQACGRALDWYSWDPGSGRRDVWSPLPAAPGTIVPPPRMLTAILQNGSYATPICSLTVRRDLLLRVGGCEESFDGLWEDQVLLAKLHLASASVVSGAQTAKYRRHEASSTERARRNGAYIRAHQVFLTWLRAYVHQAASPHPDPSLVEALEAALEPYEGARARWGWRLRAVALRVLPWRAQRLLRETLVRARRLKARGLLPVRMGSLRRLTPLSRQFGFDRGLPIDRHYVEQFLAENEEFIAGRVLEVGDSSYTRRFGGTRVLSADVLNVEAGHPETTIVADLARGEEIPSEAFDCIVLTQTLHLVYDLQAAVRTLHRILRPGGVVLATFPGISPLSTDEWADTWHWALTPLSAARLFVDRFGHECVEVASYGNVLTSVAFLQGLSAGELRPHELAHRDPQFPMLVSVRARRPVESPRSPHHVDVTR